MQNRICPTMKWSYKDCDVQVTATVDSKRSGYTPIVEVDCTTVAVHRAIVISKSFPTPAVAEKRGRALARDWIDRNLGK
jgi:hypothetical protein